jgi:hypothetical protein
MMSSDPNRQTRGPWNFDPYTGKRLKKIPDMAIERARAERINKRNKRLKLVLSLRAQGKLFREIGEALTVSQRRAHELFTIAMRRQRFREAKIEKQTP